MKLGRTKSSPKIDSFAKYRELKKIKDIGDECVDGEQSDDKQTIEEKNGLTISDLLKVYLCIAVGLFLLFPTLYFKSQIYYVSRDISGLLIEHAALLEEN
ncbi:MAG: hypothetical protein LBG67_05305, partial [Campylobacteraceae bacterium]|nr:hypothetical protein [Campylobacteraceae bacterium]